MILQAQLRCHLFQEAFLKDAFRSELLGLPESIRCSWVLTLVTGSRLPPMRLTTQGYPRTEGSPLIHGSTSPQVPTAHPPHHCAVCMQFVRKENLLSLACQHQFCRSCWEQHCSVLVKDGVGVGESAIEFVKGWHEEYVSLTLTCQVFRSTECVFFWTQLRILLLTPFVSNTSLWTVTEFFPALRKVRLLFGHIRKCWCECKAPSWEYVPLSCLPYLAWLPKWKP